MDKFDRIQQLHRIFVGRTFPITVQELSEKLECSEKTVKRSLDTLRDYSQAPLEYVSSSRGWRYNPAEKDRFELPGLWLTTEEIHSLAIMLQLIQRMDDQILSTDIEPIEKAIDQLLTSRNVNPASFKQHIRYLPKTRCQTNSKTLSTVSSSLLDSVRLQLKYLDYKGSVTEREVSPLKLVHYQENWYLDAWCHLRNELRSFMVARIESVMKLDTPSIKVNEEQQQAHFASSYGIFSGKAKHIAKLKFFGPSATEAASYQWHPDQISEWQGRSYLLNIPYNDDRELVRTLLAYGDGVEIMAPAALKKKLLTKAKQIVAMYDASWKVGRF